MFRKQLDDFVRRSRDGTAALLRAAELLVDELEGGQYKVVDAVKFSKPHLRELRIALDEATL